MSCDRRKFIQQSIALTVCSAASNLFFSAPGNAASPSIPLQQTLDELSKGAKINATEKISIQVPTIAENGAVVPITVTSSLNDVRSIYILVEKNPIPLSARFDLSPELDTFVSARLKMAETCDVIVIAQTNEALYSAKEKVKVTIGGCGG